MGLQERGYSDLGYVSPGTQNTRHISCLDSATDKGFNTYFLSSPTTRPKKEPFLQMSLQERGYSDLGYTSLETKMGLPYRYSIRDYSYSVGDPF